MTLTPIQQLILQAFVIEPEDKTAFKRAQAAAKSRRLRAKNPEKRRARQRALRAANREKVLEYQKAWREKHPDRVREYERRYWEANPEKAAEKSRRQYQKDPEKAKQAVREWRRAHPAESVAYTQKYQKSHPDKVREFKRLGAANRRKKDPRFRAVLNLRRRVLLALSGLCKSQRTLALIGCTVEEWGSHLESQFKPGMTWENYGLVWHIDHIRPCASFDLSDPVQQSACFNWSNTQPLFALENLKKGAK